MGSGKMSISILQRASMLHIEDREGGDEEWEQIEE
jgi:hypothetical protein